MRNRHIQNITLDEAMTYSESYNGKEIEVQIPEWLAKKHGFDTVYLEGFVVAETKRAIKLELCDGDNIWLPKSCIVDNCEVDYND